MLRLRSSVDAERAHHFAELLRDLDGIRRVVQQDDHTAPSAVVFTADVEPAAADRLVDEIAALGIGVDDYLLSRVEVVAPLRHHITGDRGIDGFAWVEVLGQARANSRPLARYLALINVAAVIAALGVITSSSILIVGAMAVSPDLLPICATCVAIVGGRPNLARRAFTTLALGLLLVVVTAAVLSALLKWTGILPDGFTVEQSALSTLAHTDYSTVLIALAAGIAAMLTFETRASTAVGVAISVTTIPASAYLGVAIGGGGASEALSALVVLLINVSLMIVSGSITLAVQRWLPNRSRAPV
ncbi:MAG: DUF389 domain-containing protein [Solirubrobacterales bacterium]